MKIVYSYERMSFYKIQTTFFLLLFVGLTFLLLVAINKPNLDFYVEQQHVIEHCSVKTFQDCSSYEIPNKWTFPIDKSSVLDLSRVLLIVHFNNQNSYDSIKWAKILYEEIFGEIVFCGPGVNSRTNKTALMLAAKFVSYIDWTRHDDFFRQMIAQKAENFYGCLETALSAIESANPLELFDGVLSMSDDMLFNFWQLKLGGFSTDQNWLMAPDPPFVFDINTGNFCENSKLPCSLYGEDLWMWPNIYRFSILSFYGEFSTRPEWREMFNRLTNLTNGQSHRLIGRTSADCFYIAKSYIREAIDLFRLFNRYRVYMEIAVPTTLHMVSWPNLDKTLRFLNTSGHNWATNDPQRPQGVDMYSTDLQLAHPFKMSRLFHENIVDEVKRRPNCLYCALAKLTQRYAQVQREINL